MLASLALTLSLLTIFGAAGYLALRMSEMRRTQALLDSAAQATRREIERELSFIENLIAGVAGQALVSNALSDSRHGDDLVYPFLRDTLRGHSEFSSIALINYRGDIVSAFGQAFSTGVSLPTIAQAVVDTQKPHTLFIKTQNGSHMLRAWPVVYLPTGNVEGAIVAEVIAQKLLPLELANQTPPFSVTLLTESGLPLASRGALFYEDTIRVEMPVTTASPADFGAIRLITETPRATALAPLKQLQLLYTLMALVAVATSIFFSRRMASRIASPIEALRDAARRATIEGHAALQSVPVFGQGELADLANSFNAMSLSLQESHAELEARVEGRTIELRRAREQIKSILDSVAEVVYSSSPTLQEFLFVSASSTSLLGVPPERLTATPGLWLSMIHPDDTAAVRAAHEAASQGQVSEIEYRIQRPDGQIRWVRNRFQLQATREQGIRVSGTLADITAAIEADIARRRAEETLRTLHRAIQASSAGVIITDTTEPDNPVIMVNPAFERITGYTQQEVLGRNCRFLQGPDTSDSEIKRLKQAIENKTDCKVILKNYRKNGAPFWNELSIAPVEDAQGHITQFVGIMNEITALVDYQHQIIQWGERLDAIFTLSPDGFVSLDAKGRITFANPAVMRMTGLSSSALLGLDQAGFDQLMQQLADPSHPYPTLVSDPPTPEAHREALIYLIRPQPIILKRIQRSAAGGAVSSIIYFHDMTREMEVDRMKSEFLSTAAHELRTPMASVMGFSELLLHREFPREMQREYLEIIHRQAKRLTSLLNDLLDLARIEARRRGALVIGRHSLTQIAKEAVAALMVPGDARSVEMHLPATALEVEADAVKIAQALTNLLSNAYKYSPKGGKIAITAVERDHAGAHQVGIAVRDEGIGMTSAQLSRAFERFFRADDTGAIPGTGLGLSLVKEIIETHGGEVTLTSEFGKGTVATIWLPLAKSTPLAA
jgi:PAS domain S-box-containing protein